MCPHPHTRVHSLDDLTSPWILAMGNATSNAAAWVNGSMPGLVGTSGIRGTGLLLNGTSAVPGEAPRHA